VSPFSAAAGPELNEEVVGLLTQRAVGAAGKLRDIMRGASLVTLAPGEQTSTGYWRGSCYTCHCTVPLHGAFTARKYSQHWVNVVDSTRLRETCKQSRQTGPTPSKTHTRMATATHTRPIQYRCAVQHKI
jgi:hypothetical protein